MGDHARVQRAGVAVEHAEAESQGRQGQKVEHRRRLRVHATEHEPRDHRRRPRAPPVAKRREHEPAKQELLAHRRDHARQRRAQHEQRRAFVGPKLFERFLFFRMHRSRPDRSEHDERDQQQHDHAGGASPARARAAQPELPGAHHAPAQMRAVDRRQHEANVLHDGVRDRQPRREVAARDLRSEQGRRDDVHHEGPHEGEQQPCEQRHRRRPRRPCGAR